MTIEFKPLPELNRQAFEILSREIGIVDAVRFFSQLWPGSGDYTKERRDLFKDLTFEEYEAEVRGTPPTRS